MEREHLYKAKRKDNGEWIQGSLDKIVYEYPNNADTDRPDLGICDYIDVNTIGVDENICCCRVSKAIIEHDTSIIKSGGDSQIFVGKFYDKKKNRKENR